MTTPLSGLYEIEKVRRPYRTLIMRPPDTIARAKAPGERLVTCLESATRDSAGNLACIPRYHVLPRLLVLVDKDGHFDLRMHCHPKEAIIPIARPIGCPV